MVKYDSIFIQRMCRKINSYQISFSIQSLQISPTFGRKNLRSSDINHIFSTKQWIHRGSFICLITVAVAHQRFKEHFSFRIYSKELFTFQFRETIKTTRKCQAFHILLIASIQIDTLHKIENPLKRAIRPTLFHYTLYCRLPYSFHSSQSKADITMPVYRKFKITFIYIRTKYLYSHRLTLIHQLCDISNVRQTSTHNGSHIFWRIVRFQISCLIRHPWVTSSMRFIKRIRSKLFPVGPNLLKNFRIMSILPSAFNKLRFHMIQLITQLFTHRFT